MFEYNHDYFEGKFIWDGWKVILGFLSKMLGVHSVLDIGAARGYAVYCGLQIGLDIYGIEPYGATDELLVHPSLRNRIKVAYADNIPFKDNQFDAVVSSSVYEHIPYDTIDKCIQEAIRVAPLAFLNIDTEDKPDHEIVEPRGWWEQKLVDNGYAINQGLTKVFSGLHGHLFGEGSNIFICNQI